MSSFVYSYHPWHGVLDVKAANYTCFLRKRGGDFHFFSGASPYAELILSPDAGLSPERGETVLLEAPESFSGEAEKVSFTFGCSDGVRTILTFLPDRVEYKAERTGGEPVEAGDFFLGRGSRFFSGRLFTPGWPDHTLPVGHYLRREEPVELSPGLMSPPPWCFSARQEDGRWMGFALEPEEHEFDFYDFGSAPGNGHDFAWRVGYGGYRAASRTLSVPALTLRFGLKDEFEAFRLHAANIVDIGRFTPAGRAVPAWHRGVSVCGWRWQKSKQNLCTQERYEEGIRMLEANGVAFDTLIIDDFWGDPAAHGVWKAGSQWPDLRGFIEARHREGRRVLLWVCTYGTGIPDGEMIGDRMQNLDSPAWRARLAEDARRLLSDGDGCYNADGLKYDFTALLPKAPGALKSCGVGYLRERFRLVYEAMTAVKPEAMIVCQSLNPYFTPYQSAIRLNDFTALPQHGLEEMRIRARLAREVGFGLPVDPDHISFGTWPYRGGYDFFRSMKELGCVSLYLTEEDFADPELCGILRELTRC